MKSSGGTFAVFIAGFTANRLVTTGAKCSAAVFAAWSISSEQYRADICLASSVVQRPMKLIDCLWPKGISNFGSGKSYSYYPKIDMAMVADVSQVLKALHGHPDGCIKELRNWFCHRPRLIL